MKEEDQTYTAYLDILSQDEKSIASETIKGLDCYFSQNVLLAPARCHYKTTDDWGTYALTLDLVTTTSLEIPPFSRPEGVEVGDTQISLSMDVQRDNTFIPYGYGKIMFDPEECTRL